MADAVRVTMTGHEQIWRKLMTLPTSARRELAKELGAQQVQNIKDRVAERRSIHGTTYRASLRAERENGQTLIDTGAMMKAMGVRNYTADEVLIGFGSALEAMKAIWAQYGTRAFTLAKGKAFPIMKNGGSKKIIAWARSKSATPPRPFFGASRNDIEKLIFHAQKFYRDTVRLLGLD